MSRSTAERGNDDHVAGVAIVVSMVLTGAAVALLLARDGALALILDVDVAAAAVAVVAATAGTFAVLRLPPQLSRLWWPASITLLAAIIISIALAFRFAMTQQWTDELEIAGELREVQMHAPRGEGPYPGLVLVGRLDSDEAAFLGRFLAERGLVVLYSTAVSDDDIRVQAAQAAVELSWLTGDRRVDETRSGFYGAGEVAGLAAAAAPEAQFVVTVLDDDAVHPGIWREVRIPVLALVGGDGGEGSPSAESLVDQLIDVIAPEALTQFEWLIFEASDRRLRESRPLGLAGLPQGFPVALPLWIHGLADDTGHPAIPMPWMPPIEEHAAP